MSCKPILFNTEMVRAILSDRKTQTRRLAIFPYNDTDGSMPERCSVEANGRYCFYLPKADAPLWRLKPLYHTGDILWVRETWAHIYADTTVCGSTYALENRYIYRADEDDESPERWRPSVHMPREATRIFLRVTDVRAERLQEISEADAKAEGIRSYWLHKEHGGEWHECNHTFVGAKNTYPTRKRAFAELWDDLNAKHGQSWSNNPWVWVYAFERTEKP